MGTQPEEGTYDATVYQWATTDPITGGPGGIANAPLLNLANRTGWLKGQVTSLLATIAALAGLNSPTFTGSPRVPTPAAGDNSTLISDTAFVQETVNGLANISLGGGGTVNLPQPYYGCPILHLTGSTTGPIYLVFPTQSGFWTVIDDTSGAFPIYLKTAAGNAITTLPGQPCDVVCDGTNIRYADGVGTMSVQGNLNLYVAPGGSDARTGLSSTYPMATIQGAVNAAYRYFQGDGGSLIINLAAGTYTSAGSAYVVNQPAPAGFAQILLNGAGAVDRDREKPTVSFSVAPA